MVILDILYDPMPAAKRPTERRALGEVGIPNEGASPTGSSFYKTLLACPREFALAHVEGIRPVIERDELSIGIIFHHALMVYYRAIYEHQQRCKPATRCPVGNEKLAPEWQHFFWGNQREAGQAAFASVLQLAAEPGYTEIYETVERCLEAYFETYWRTDRWIVVAVEETIIRNGLPTPWSARLDLFIHDMKDDGLWICEHKTAKFINADLIDNYEMDIQILGQKWLVQRCVDLTAYPHFKGVLINIVSKAKTPKLVRTQVSPSPAHLREFENTLASLPVQRKVYERLGWPKFLGHCSGYARGYSRCQFYSLCHDYPEVTPAQWRGFDLPEEFERKEVAVP